MTSIHHLKSIFKLDLNHVLDNVISKENFIELDVVIFDIIKSIEREKISNNQLKLETTNDKLISFCLERMNFLIKQDNNDKTSLFEVDKSSTGWVNFGEEIFLKYLQHCYDNCSNKVKYLLLKIYVAYFLRSNTNQTNELISSLPKDVLNCQNDLLVPPNCCDFLNNFSLIILSKTSDKSYLTSQNVTDLLKFLVDYALTIINADGNDTQLIKLSISLLTRVASLNEEMKYFVLNEFYIKLKENLSNDSSDYRYLNENKKRLESFVQDSNLSLLTSLADQIVELPGHVDNGKISFLNKSEYWHLIQTGLAHTNSLTRKRALYLLKRTNDLVSVNKNAEINSESFDLFHKSANEYDQVHWYQATWSVWNDFFLCIELLEESSVHIIKPSLVKVNGLIESVKLNKFHYTWLLSLFSRAFLHESKFIVRWAVSTFLQSDLHALIDRIPPNDQTRQDVFINKMNSFLFGPLILTLQKYYLYNRADDTSFVDNCPKIAYLHSKFFDSYIKHLPDEARKNEFLENFTLVLSCCTWNATCLFLACKPLYDFDSAYLPYGFTTITIRNIYKIITSSLSTQEVLLRSSTQTALICSLIKNVKSSKLTNQIIKDMIDIINCVSTKECLTYLNSTWCLLVDWFKKAIKSSTANMQIIASYLSDELNSFLNETNTNEFTMLNTSSKLAKFLLILIDTNEESIYKSTIELLHDRLLTCNKYVYMAMEKVEKCLFIFNNMIGFVSASEFSKESRPKVVENLHSQTSCEIIDFVVRKLNAKNEQAFIYEHLLVYNNLLENLLKFQHDRNVQISSKLAKSLVSNIISSLNDKNEEKLLSTEWKRFVCVNLLAVLFQTCYAKDVLDEICGQTSSDIFLANLVNFKLFTKSFLLTLRKDDLADGVVDNINRNFSIILGRFNETLWIIYDFLIKETSETKILELKFAKLEIDLADCLLDKYNESLELISPQCLTSFVRCSKSFVCLLNNSNKSHQLNALLGIFEKIYKLIWDIEQDVKNFNESFVEFLANFLNKNLFALDSSDNVKQLVMKICFDVIRRGELKPCVVKPLVDTFLQLVTQFNSDENEYFIDLLIEFLVFGDVYKKDKKYVKDIEIYIESLGDSFGTNQLIRAEYLYDASVRMKTLFHLIQSNNNLTTKFYDSLMNRIIDKDLSILNQSNYKLYINSLVHRERLRIWQFILTVLPKLDKKNLDKLIDYAEKSLITESQPSIRIVIEWVLIRIISTQLDTIDLNVLWKKIENFSTKKTGYTCSWLTVLTHLAALVPSLNQKIDFMVNFLPVVLSQILSSNFHIRTFVEAILIKLYTDMQLQPYEQVNTGLNESKFLQNEQTKILIKQIYSIIRPAIDDKERHARMVLNHFYFQFNPVQDYSIQTIYHLFPYLSGIIDEELLTVEHFLSIVLDKRPSELTANDYKQLKQIIPIELISDKTRLSECTPGIWKFTAYRDESVFEPTVSIEDLQKKIIPWFTMIPRQEDMNDMSKKASNTGGLILFSSLIDKGTNLGGICRTCEIFNVKELIVGSMKYTEDKLFQNLSVTSENWITIKEVPLKNMRTYFMEMKLSGYTLIGLEQTANSVKLNKFQFPFKSLLVLGNEKEGIPADIIQLLDICIEIPQLGVIRSLNVHVSASIAIWEYSKQQLNI